MDVTESQLVEHYVCHILFNMCETGVVVVTSDGPVWKTNLVEVLVECLCVHSFGEDVCWVVL